MPKIFLSYRREDSKYPAGEMAKRLAAAFGQNSVVYDVDNIPAGQDFRTHIKNELKSCDLLLAVIGARWLDATDDRGRPRLEQSDDWVRLELETALERNIPVVPVLLDNVAPPNPALLPKSLRQLAYRQAHSVRPPSDFDHDVQVLIQKIKASQKSLTQTFKLAGKKPQSEDRSWWKGRPVLVGASIAAVALVTTVGGLFVFSRKGVVPQANAAVAEENAETAAELRELEDDEGVDSNPASNKSTVGSSAQANFSGNWVNPRTKDEFTIDDNGTTIDIALVKPMSFSSMSATFRRAPNGIDCVSWNAVRGGRHINGKGSRLVIHDDGFRIVGLKTPTGPRGRGKPQRGFVFLKRKG